MLFRGKFGSKISEHEQRGLSVIMDTSFIGWMHCKLLHVCLAVSNRAAAFQSSSFTATVTVH